MPSATSRMRPGAAGVVTIVGTERPTPARSRDRLDRARRRWDAARRAGQDADRPDRGGALHRREPAGACSTAGGVTFGIAICHEGFRYPEIVRSLVLGGAQVVFVPHFVTTDDGSLPTRWCDASNPYNEKALLCRALENTVYVAASNVAGPDQGSVDRHHRPGRHPRREPRLRRRGRRRGRHRSRPCGPPTGPALGSRAQRPDSGSNARRHLERQAFTGSMRSTKSARQAGASNGLAKYDVTRAILPSRISPMPT